MNIIITGEKIQQNCDYYIGDSRNLHLNPLIKNDSDKWINIDNHNLDDIKNLRINKLFCYNDMLKNHYFGKLKNILKNISYVFELYFHNGDEGFYKHHLILFDIKNLKNIYAQNLNTSLIVNLHVLPIGIANSQWKHGDLNTLVEIINSSNEKQNEIYFNFNIGTNVKKRQLCYDTFIDKIDFIKSKNSQNEYLKCLSSHKYCICPEGNGLDTHRFWECLYLKVIPICLKNVITEYYSNYLPIILLDNWSDIDIKNIRNIKQKTNSWENYDIVLNINNYI
jgi:hypothetical protein